MTVEDRLFAFAAIEASGLVVSTIVLAASFGVFVRASGLVAILAAVVGAVAVAGLVGSTLHLARRRRVRRLHPAPGRMVVVAGRRMHVHAEGPRDALSPAVVWIPGGHVGAFAMHHLHVALRGETRSLLIDRFGTGWSDTGPFPRTTAREADEFVEALEGAGERGPFVFAGHSFGGLLAANIARRRPDLVHSVVLIDPTPLDVIAFGPRLGALKAMRRASLRAAFATAFGIDARARQERRQRAEPAYATVLEQVERVLGDAGRSLRAVEGTSVGACLASASIYRELIPRGLAERAWDTVVYDGDLGALPVYLVAPQDTGDVGTLPEFRAGDRSEGARMVSFFARCRERYLATSSNARRVVAPAGSGHNFPYTVPDFTIDAMRRIVVGDPPARRGAA